MIEKLNIYQRLALVMAGVKYIQKGEAKVNNQYRFVSHDAVVREIRRHLIKNGIVAVPTVLSHKVEGQNRTEVDVEVAFVNIDDPADKITVKYFGYGIDKSDKGPGKAISYAVKYAYLKVLSLETGDDPENDDIEHTEETVTDEQLINLREICESHSLPIDETLSAMAKKAFRLKKIEDLPQTDFPKAQEMLDKKGKQWNKKATNGKTQGKAK